MISPHVPCRELDSRTSGGIHVRLLWHPRDGHVPVAADDIKTGESFVLLVQDGERPLDVFRHPYAHAAPRGRPPVGPHSPPTTLRRTFRPPALFLPLGSQPGSQPAEPQPVDWQGTPDFAMGMPAPYNAPEIPAPAIDLARQLLARFRYRLGDPAVIRSRLGGGK